VLITGDLGTHQSVLISIITHCCTVCCIENSKGKELLRQTLDLVWSAGTFVRCCKQLYLLAVDENQLIASEQAPTPP